MICSRWDVAVVPFPFVERPGVKRRPAVVLSDRAFNSHGHSVLAMITTQGEPAWPGDVWLADLTAAGLREPCLVRLKLFTLDNRLILRVAGHLSRSDAQRAASELDRVLA